MADIIQGTAEWFAVRCGKATASKIADIIAKTKSGPSALRATYKAQLIAERLTGTVAESYSNAAMQWGIEKEPDARAEYAFARNVDVAEIAFVDHPAIAMSGASPDGLIGSDGLLEIKCPATATHLDTLINGTIAGKYVTQMQWQMACTGRQWCDFVSFDPRMPAAMRLFIHRVPADAETIKSLEAQVIDFLDEIDRDVSVLRAKYEMKEAA